MIRFAATAAILAFALCPASADDDRFQAMALLVSGSAEGPAGDMRDGRFVELWNTENDALADIVAPGPGGCVAQWHSMRQDRGGWVTASVSTYDFGKVENVRYLADDDDWETAPSREPDDPGITMIMLDGEDWNCQQVVHIDPAKPYFALHCNSNWTVVASSPEEVATIRAAVDRVRADCSAR